MVERIQAGRGWDGDSCEWRKVQAGTGWEKHVLSEWSGEAAAAAEEILQERGRGSHGVENLWNIVTPTTSTAQHYTDNACGQLD